jgi:putative CocE/NonD family hydrolase
MKGLSTILAGALALCWLSLFAAAPAQPPSPAAPAAAGGDIPAHFTYPTDTYDYERREVMIPMRDGVRLHTVIIVPRGAHELPILLTRTPYNASARASRTNSPHMLAALPEGDEMFVRDGYIRVFQDIRGKYGSEGDYVVTRPVRGPLNPTATDHTTDAWDTIDWLVHNLPQSNGRVGMIGSSYEGFTVAMALLNPHPALRVAAPESPMIDGWMGDDWFHYGAFRQANIGWIGSQTGYRGRGEDMSSGALDDYETFRRVGSAGAWARQSGFDQLPYWQRMSEHPAYDAFWQGQALDRLIAAHPSNVPTMWIQGLWDQEDMYGAVMTWEALKAAGHESNNYLVMGPWRHSQVNYNGSTLGPFHWDGDTALQFRRDVLLPFFDHYLKDRPAADPPRALIYNTGENHWDRFPQWPLACAQGCAAPLTPLYLEPDFGLGFQHPAGNGADSYVSDPAKPVPYLVRPISFADGERWRQWLVADQRPFSDRTDVLVYETEPLTAPLRISGPPIVDLHAITSGTDADWVVKLIDVYPDQVASDPQMGGYQLAVSLDIFRGRYRESFARPTPIPAGRAQTYRFRLPTTNHVFQPGHRIMVQIQSSLFPLYDRNPQTYVPNIFFARPEDYRRATQTVLRGSAEASAILLPIVR